MEENTIIVIDEQGNEVQMEILFTFDDESRNKKYVLYFNPAVEDGEVYASSYDDDGNLNPVDSEEEWAMVEEVFGAFLDEAEKEQ